MPYYVTRLLLLLLLLSLTLMAQHDTQTRVASGHCQAMCDGLIVDLTLNAE